ncbi:hypothetical protein [Bradyrhizobium betae]|uniref:Uncharacterized protein n=1 Tax=Bradyrhizobium betae TaxID=244734 RepID=A0A5P6PB92_9BRAD|nr:hypothetical protein [Bradyrhizobium betae]MCS3727363.1 hypothetical protein [Bradyrhizobium betae]QFI74743.1 hypothetical protein F8237_21430 [Bradyrhizobium betae]
MHHQTTSTRESLSAPIGDGELARLGGIAGILSRSADPERIDFMRVIPGWVLHERSEQPACDVPDAQPRKVYGILSRKADTESREEPAKLPTRHKAPMPGLRGPGSKSLKRSTSEFSEGFGQVAETRRCDRIRRAARRAEHELELEAAAQACGMTLREARAKELAGAQRACEIEYAGGPKASEYDHKLCENVERAQHFAKMRADEATRDDGSVFRWPGGIVVDGCWRAAFEKRGLKSSEHPHFERVAASAGRPNKKNLLAGDSKGGCWRHVKKLYALDRLYLYTCVVCKDMWRLDIDRDFESFQHLCAWIEYIVEEYDLPCRPHFYSAIPDERRPGMILHPHLWFLLPEGCAVWPNSPPRQHAMLKAVIEALAKAFGADKGGCTLPHMGKNPLSPLCEAHVIEPERMPTLGEWFEALDCEFVPDSSPALALTIQTVLDGASCLGEESTGWFKVTQAVGGQYGREMYKSGKVDISNVTRFAKAIQKAISGPLTQALRPTAGKQAATLAKMIESVSAYVARTFDPAKFDKKRRNKGAAAHLIHPGMTKEEREQVGGRYATTVRMDKSIEALAEAIRLDLLCGRSPTIASVAAKGIRCLNTVARHFDSAYAIAKSRIPEIQVSMSFRGLFWGRPALPALKAFPGPAAAVVASSASPLNSYPPEAGDPANPANPLIFEPVDYTGTDPADLDDPDDFIADALRRVEHARIHAPASVNSLRGARRRQIRTNASPVPVGAAFAAFRAAGIRSVYPTKRAA